MTISKRKRILLFAVAILVPPLAAIISPAPIALVLLHQTALVLLTKVFIDCYLAAKP